MIVAFAGATAPAAWWLDALADGGRLLLPMTTEQRGGFMLRLDRHGAKLRGPLGRLGRLLSLRRRPQRRGRGGARARRSTIRRGSRPCAACAATCTTGTRRCWLHGDGWCLSKRELH